MFNKIDFQKIQYGGGKHSFSFADQAEIEQLVEQYNITLPEKCSSDKIKKNVAQGIWNRNVLSDFCSEDVVKKCILICLSQYRTTTTPEKDSDSALSLYYKVLQMPYKQRLSDEGLSCIYQTLIKWNMNTRGAKLACKKDFKDSLLKNEDKINELSDYSLLDFENEARTKIINEIVKHLFDSLNLTKNSKFVTLSKTLHFLHPQLMIPMDRTYTANYFHNFSNPDLPGENTEQAKWNIEFHKALCKVYLKHKDLFDNLSLQTRFPLTKLLDDILIGFQLYRRNFCNQFSASYIMNN